MPVILDDEMLIPPSLRRKRYIENDRCIEVSNGSVIELPPHEPRANPIIIHQDRYGDQRPTEIIRAREIIMDPSSGSGVGRRYRVDELDVLQYSRRRGRARSVGNESYTDSSYDDTDSYYLEDGSRHGHSRRGHRGAGIIAGAGAGLIAGAGAGALAARHHRHQSPQRVYVHDGHHHNGRHLGEAALGGAVVHKLRHRSSSTSSGSSDGRGSHGSHHHRIRHVTEAGIATAGAKSLYDHRRAHRGSRVYHHDHDPHRHARHLAEAGLGIAAAGAAKELYDHRRRSRSRSSDSSRSRSRSQSHTGRHVAAAALGATAAGLAAHKLRHRRDSYSSYSSGDDDHHHHDHRGRKVAGGLAGVTAAGLAAKHYHDHRHRSRSSSASSTSSRESSHKLRNAALGLGAAGLAAHHYHKKEQERRSRSRSRPGILRHRSRSYSAPRQRSHSRGPELAKVAVATMAGALAQRHHDHKQRSRSVDAGQHRRRHHELGEKRVHYRNDPRAYERSIHPESSVSNRPRSRRGSMGGVGSMIKNAIMPEEHRGQNGSEHRSRSRSLGRSLGHGLAEEMAYRVGEGVAGGLSRHR